MESLSTNSLGNWARVVAFVCFSTVVSLAEVRLPNIVRVFPLGGQAGTDVTLEILGDRLSNTTVVNFDSSDITWLQTIESSSRRLKGIVRIAPNAAFGPHMLRASTLDGHSTSAMFNVDQFPSVMEAEPNGTIETAQQIDTFPAEVQGRLDGAADLDIFAFRVRKGERRIFDLRSIEHGSAVEVRMILLDSSGKRVAFNDDRDDFDENPLVEHTFQESGTYYVKLDQYRGPRGFNFGKNCSYILRVSNLPQVSYVSPLGLRSGKSGRIRINGKALADIKEVYLKEIRQAEYARMTYPYTMPIRFSHDSTSEAKTSRISGKIVGRSATHVDAEFQVLANAQSGLWRLWAVSPQGVTDGISIEISQSEEFEESQAADRDLPTTFNLNGCLCQSGKKDVYRFQGKAGQPLHFSTLAAQIGVPRLDSVLQLRDSAGKKLAENDDVVAGQGSLLGNSDSSLFYTPKEDGPLFLTVRDRTGRGGPDFQYRLKVDNRAPSFQLFTTPENFTAAQGGTGTIKVHLVREAGFEGEVSVWFEGFPPGIEPPKGKFRADQLFEPNADGADMIIPEIAFSVSVPSSVLPGRYPIRVFGVASNEEGNSNRRVVEGHATVMIGPLLDLWNFIRRPAPEIELTVTAPFESQLLLSRRSLKISPSATESISLKTTALPTGASFRVANIPPGLTYKVTDRQADSMTVAFSALECPAGAYEVTLEAKVENRWTSADALTINVQPPRAVQGSPTKTQP